jgi:GT2 family glycosyltransferase
MNVFSIAVVILNWNGKDLLAKFLPTVLANSQHPNVRVVVADNASSDGSVDIVRERFPQVHLVVLEQNFGFAAGYNKALGQLNDDYFVLLNSDAVPAPNWLVPFMDAIAVDSEFVLAMPKIRSFKNPELFEYAGAAGGFIDKYGYPFCRGRIMDEVEEDRGQYDSAIEVFWASGAAMFVKAKLYEQIGGLDEDFFAHMEEIDFCWRMKNLGCKVWVVPQSVVYHVGGASLHHSHPRKTYLNFRNNLFMLLKNLPKDKLIYILFMRMVLDGVAALKFIISGQGRFAWAVFKAHLSFYRFAPLYLKKRKMAHAKGILPIDHGQIYPSSIVYAFFVRRVRYFSQLRFAR